jgi:DNA-binding winged helix-turn-helix (wHTH) protein/Flp pilus assembly protein TadD
MLVSPSRRLVEGPGGHVHVEPLIMEVFLLLLDAGGKVVTRTQLFDQCWGGVIVGDDSLNRAIAKVRRVGAQVAPGLYEIETIPRTGYRLTGEILSHRELEPAGEIAARSATSISRRRLVGGGAAAVAALGAGGFWSVRASEDREFNDLMHRGDEALATSDPASNAPEYFRRAVELRPDDAKAQGSLAYAHAIRTDTGQPDRTRTSLQEAETAAVAALAIEPDEPNANLAQVIIQSGRLDLQATEDGLRRVLAADPANLNAMKQLWNLLQCVGRSREAIALVERALAIKPLASGAHYPYAQLLWITGRTAEADRVIERALQYWPAHRFVRFARFMIFAFTDRPRAAMAMIERRGTAPQNFSPDSIALWRVTLPALDQPSSANKARARQAIVEAVTEDLSLTSQAAMVMSALNELSTAFEITNKYFAVGTANTGNPKSPMSARSTAWRFAPWLFTPPIAGMRADPRFEALVDQIGLTAYWRARGVKPDYQVYG